MRFHGFVKKDGGKKRKGEENRSKNSRELEQGVIISILSEYITRAIEFERFKIQFTRLIKSIRIFVVDSFSIFIVPLTIT